MDRFYRYRTIILALPVLIVVSLACNFPTVDRIVRNPVPISQQAAQELQANVEAAVNAARQGEIVSITITESQLTSYIATRMENDPGSNISELQVYFLEDQLLITGNLLQSGLTLPFQIDTNASVDGAGGLSYEILSASLGSLEMPREILDIFRSELDNSLNSQTLVNSEIFIGSVQISTGLMTITGKSR